MRRTLALMVLLSLIAGLPLVSPASGQTANLFVSNVTVTPDQPLTGEQFAIRTTIRNAQSQGAVPVEITDVIVRGPQGSGDVLTEYERVSDLGQLPPGSEMDVPITLSFDSAGQRDLRIVVLGEIPDRQIKITYPVPVTVRQGGPAVSVETSDAIVGTESTVTVEVANGEDVPVRNVRLRLDADEADVENTTRIVAALPAGESRTFAFDVTPDAERVALSSTLRYVTASGNERIVRENATLRADPLEERVRVEADVPEDDASPPVVVDVSNLGNAPLERVAVWASRDGTLLVERPIDEVAPSSTRTVRLNVTGVESDTLDVTVDYETGDREGSVSTSVEYVTNPGRVELTGIDYEREGDRVHVTGSASNVGLSEVNGVVVRVLPAEGVQPARPSREYFVGSIPASDFVSFDLYAVVNESAETMPVEISYLVDGERRTEITELDAADVPPPGADDGRRGLPFVPLVAGSGVLALAIVGAAVYLSRR